MEVLGVVRDVRSDGLRRDPSLTFYLPYWQRNRDSMTLAVRTAQDPGTAAGALRQAVASLDREIPLGDVKTMRELVDTNIAQPRFQAELLAMFALLAVALACFGLYAVVSFTIEQRRSEVGVRVALGATRAGIVAMILRQAMTPVTLGILLGLAACGALARLLSGLLYGIRPLDPVTLSAAVCLMAFVALAASVVPALRAGRTPPAATLRDG